MNQHWVIDYDPTLIRFGSDILKIVAMLVLSDNAISVFFLNELDIHLVSLGVRLGTNSPSALTGSNTEGMDNVLWGPLNILLQNGKCHFCQQPSTLLLCNNDR